MQVYYHTVVMSMCSYIVWTNKTHYLVLVLAWKNSYMQFLWTLCEEVLFTEMKFKWPLFGVWEIVFF